MSDPKKLFQPEAAKELVLGWLIHAHKGRDRHDTAARRFEGRRYVFGVPTILLSAVVGTSVFSSMEKSGLIPVVVVGLLSVTASVFAALQTFLDYAGRAARHRVVGAKYKGIIRDMERVLASGSIDPAWFDDIRGRLDALEEDAPVVAPHIYDAIEKRYATVAFVKQAIELYK
ncbi:MAG TPA: SLATT domain-containing protein [Myxococcota bacterium]|jgi:hypothetical protein|nr:SLATT domain-containing protein [Myxococcota bacterium]